MSSVWSNTAEALLKLVGRSPRSDVLSGGSTGIDSDRPRERASESSDLRFSESADLESQKPLSPLHGASKGSNDDRLHETPVQQGAPSASLASHATPSTTSVDNLTLSIQKPGSHAVSSHHRKTSSAASEASLSSVVSTTGAYTGFTQHGQYDLTHDVILRGEFISEQQAKVCLTGKVVKNWSFWHKSCRHQCCRLSL